MSDLIVYGFPRSTFVNIVRLVLTHKEVPYTFHDLEPEMGKLSHLALHPFNRVPVLQHDDFTVRRARLPPISTRRLSNRRFNRRMSATGASSNSPTATMS